MSKYDNNKEKRITDLMTKIDEKIKIADMQIYKE
jgi:hypothetical protein